MTGVLAATLIVLIAGAVLSAASARLGALCACAGGAGLTAVGVAAAGAQSAAAVDLGTWLGFGRTVLRVDGLGGIFVGLSGILAVCVSLRYLESPPSRTATALHGLLMVTLAVALTADQGYTFLLAFEAMSVVIYLIANADRGGPGALAAGYLTGGLNKVSGAGLLAAFALLYGSSGTFRFAGWQAAHLSSTTRNLAFVLIVIGFAAKIGLPPLQAALPTGYAAASGPSAATLSMALVVGFYGLWRLVFSVLAPAPLWWGETLLVVGSLTALTGILYAIAQDDLRRFLGFSSVEHTGITLLGLGAALVGQATHQPSLVAAGILAATLHVVAHALSKTLALLTVDAVEEATGTSLLGPLGGLGRSLPRTGSALAVATLTLAAMPPLAGFVSEWFTLESLLQAFRIGNTLARLLMATSAAALALTAGLGLLAFAKLCGSAILGRPRTPLPAVRERGHGVGLVLLCATTLALGPATPWEIRLLGRALEGSLGFDPARSVITHPLVLGPVYRGFSVLAPTWLAVVLPAYAAAAALIARLAGRRPARRAAPWVCGTELDPQIVQYTPAGYSNPIRVVLRGIYGFRRRLILNPDPGGTPYLLETHMTEPIERGLYEPLTGLMLGVSHQARRLQSGRLGSYLAYMLLVLLASLILIPTLGK